MSRENQGRALMTGKQIPRILNVNTLIPLHTAECMGEGEPWGGEWVPPPHTLDITS